MPDIDKFIGLQLTPDILQEIKDMFHPHGVIVVYPEDCDEDDMIFDTAFVYMTKHGGTIKNIFAPSQPIDFD